MASYIFIMGVSGVGKTTLVEGMTSQLKQDGVAAVPLHVGGIWRHLATRYPSAGEGAEILLPEIRCLDIPQVATCAQARIDGPGVALRAAHLSSIKANFDAVSARLRTLLSANGDGTFYVMEGRDVILQGLPTPVLAIALTATAEELQRRRGGDRGRADDAQRDALDGTREGRWGYTIPQAIQVHRLDNSAWSADQTRVESLRLLCSVWPARP